MAADMTKKDESRILDSIPILSAYLEKHHVDEERIEKYLSSHDHHVIFGLLSDIKDPRQSGKIKYSLVNLLIIALLTVANFGSGSFLSMETYAKSNKRQLYRLGLIDKVSSGRSIRYVIPSHDTFRRVFSLIDPSRIQEALIEPLFRFIESIAQPDIRPGLIHIQLDGKEMRGTGRKSHTKKPRKNTNMVNVYFGSYRICRYSIPVREKSNEIPIVQCILRIIDIKNKVITFDALHTQVETAKLIADRKGYYVTPLKWNQKNFRSFVETTFRESKANIKKYECPGRIFETLRIQPEWEHFGFYSSKMIVKMTSWKHDKENPEIMYFISNTFDEPLILEAINNRWGIEGGFHKDKDSMLINEDKILYTDRMAQTNIVVINNLIAAIVRWLPAFDKKMPLYLAKGHMRSHPMEIFNLIYGMANREF